MCGDALETPEHALLQCEAYFDTVVGRTLLLGAAMGAGIALPTCPLSNGDAVWVLRRLVWHWDLVVPTAEFVHDVRKWWDGV